MQLAAASGKCGSFLLLWQLAAELSASVLPRPTLPMHRTQSISFIEFRVCLLGARAWFGGGVRALFGGIRAFCLYSSRVARIVGRLGGLFAGFFLWAAMLGRCVRACRRMLAGCFWGCTLTD